VRRLVKDALSIAQINPMKLAKGGAAMTVADSDGIPRRNSALNRVKTDVSEPTCGHPDTINTNVWCDFLNTGGIPCSRQSEEGPDICFSAETEQVPTDFENVAFKVNPSASKVCQQDSAYGPYNLCSSDSLPFYLCSARR
jgi:hypothetical protein